MKIKGFGLGGSGRNAASSFLFFLIKTGIMKSTRKNKTWTRGEIYDLFYMRQVSKCKFPQIAANLGRTEKATSNRYYKEKRNGYELQVVPEQEQILPGIQEFSLNFKGEKVTVKSTTSFSVKVEPNNVTITI